MNDHFWPSLYPGMIVGGLVGLTFGGFISVLVGAAGGAVGAGAMYFLTTWLGLEDSILSLAGLIAGSIAGSYALATLLARFSERR